LQNQVAREDAQDNAQENEIDHAEENFTTAAALGDATVACMLGNGPRLDAELIEPNGDVGKPRYPQAEICISRDVAKLRCR
jgi:hypothetical protein